MGLMDKMEQSVEKDERKQEERLAGGPLGPPTVEYDVIELREKMIGMRGDAPTDKLRSLLNARAKAGWRLKHLVHADVAGLVGKRDGWMVIFERDL